MSDEYSDGILALIGTISLLAVLVFLVYVVIKKFTAFIEKRRKAFDDAENAILSQTRNLNEILDRSCDDKEDIMDEES